MKRKLSCAEKILLCGAICLISSLVINPTSVNAEKSLGEATISSFRQAADQGDAYGQNNLGLMYYRGEGVQKDYNKAAEWFRKAADQGDRGAQYYLGRMYHGGEGVQKDYNKAAEWLRKAADQGHAKAQYNLGVMYYKGEGFKEDYEKAYGWALLASKNGYSKLEKALSSKLTRQQKDAGRRYADISPVSFGSGFLVKGGFVITCFHVIDNNSHLNLIVVEYENKEYTAKVVDKDQQNDIALLQIPPLTEGALFRPALDIRLGQDCFTLGYPMPAMQGKGVKFNNGTISSLSGPGEDPRLYQISVPLQPGNSGGPLFDEHGNFAGIAMAKQNALLSLQIYGSISENVGYAIKSDYFLPIAKRIDGFKIEPPNTKAKMLDQVGKIKSFIVMVKGY